MKKNRNLAQYLTDEQTIKDYLHKDKASVWELLKFAYEPFKGDWKIKGSLIVFALANGVIPVTQAFIMYYLVDLIEKQTNLATMIWTIILYGLIFFLCSVISHQIDYRTYAKYNQVRMKTFVSACEKTMYMDYGLGENANFKAEISKAYVPFSNNTEGLEGIYHDMYQVLSNLVSFILLSIIIFGLSPIIFAFAVISIILQVLIRNYTDAYRHKHNIELQKVSIKSDRYYKEASDFSYAKDIRLFSFKENFIKGFRPMVEDVYRLSRKFVKPEMYLSPVLAILLVGIEAVGYYYLSGQIIRDSINLKNLTLVITSIGVYTSVISSFVMYFSQTKSNLRFFADGYDLIKAYLSSENGDNTIAGPLSIEFEDVSFAYPLSDKLVLENLSFKIKAEEKIAIVGVNGAGKSTIVSLILGLYKPTKGKIYINGIDSEEIDLANRYRAFATVLQNVEPLAVSIAENVAATDKNIDRQRVVESLEAAGLAYKIDQLPKGIDTQMTKNIEEDGTNFSGGENQKLAIARALYKKDSSALIMDEPTAALDALAEEAIYKQIDEISDGKTLIFISHRLASTRFCDKIMLLDGGNIKEYGSHNELLRKDGLYKEMYESQKKYYQEENNEISSLVDAGKDDGQK